MNLILNDIKNKLKEIDPRVYYGMVDDEVVKKNWDYIVFNRSRLKTSQNKTGYTDEYDVSIIRENFIPEGIDLEIIEKMCELHGMRLSGADGDYNYIMKPNTNIVVEMLTLHFVRARK